MDYKAFEATPEQVKFEERITKEYELSMGHSVEDYLQNNGW